MRHFTLKFLVIIILAITIYSCDDDDSNSQVVIDFGTAPTSSLITTGTINVITENTVRYHDYKEGGLSLSLPNGFFPGDTGADWF